MKIIQLTAENVKKLTAVQITPDGNVVQITGKNGQGKTSVLDAIWWALAGTANVQSQPIRKGAESARIEVKLGTGKAVQLTVERRFTETASYLTVKTADGAKYPSPQKLLDDLLGTLTFDPLAFMRQDARGQFDVLRGLVKLDFDLDAMAKLDKSDFDARTVANREAKALRAQAVGIPIALELPAERIDECAMLDAIQTAAAANTELEQRKARRKDHSSQIIVLRDGAKDKRDQAAKLIEEAKAREARAEAMQTEIDAAPELPEPTDIGGLRASLDAAKATNSKITDRERRKEIEGRAERLEDKAKGYTKDMETRATARAIALEKAQMPVDGLSFGDGAVLFTGLPLDQASDAEQLMVSTSIAAALNPKLRVLRIRDGSLLDDDAMVRLADFAKERDLQIWIERVDGSGTVGVVMEDGHVRGQEPKAEAAE